MKIYFKKKWGQFVDFNNLEEEDNYIGRAEQIEHLKSTIINNESGSILVSGERGTGKTAFIYKTIKEIKREGEEKIIPVLINVNQIYKNGEELDSELLIKNLIRRLCAELLHLKFEEKFNIKVKKLYNKAISEYISEEKFFNNDTVSNETNNQKIDTIETKVNKKEILKLVLLFGLTTWGANFSSEYLFDFISTLQGFSFYLAIFLSLVVLFLIIFILFTKLSIEHIHKSSVVGNNIKVEEVSEIYKKDNSIGNLEFELNDLLDELNKEHIILFVIDELDKISGEGNAIGKLIKMYKNLFTLSKANFIFITDQIFYTDLLVLDKTKDEHPTLFTFKYYLDYPSFEDLRKYLNHIINKCEGVSNDEKKDIINYLLLTSNNDFFNLKELIHSLINYKDGEGYIDVEVLKNNDNYIKEKAYLYEKFELFYLKYKSSKISLFHKNYVDLKELFLKLGNKFNNDIRDIHEDIKGDMLRNTIFFLVRAGIIKIDSVGEYFWTFNYSLLNEVNLNYKTDLEQEFINNFLKYIELINRIDDIGNNFDEYNKNKEYKKILSTKLGDKFTGNIGALELFNKYKKDYNKLSKGEITDFIPFDILEQNSLDLANNVINLENNYYQIFINIIIELFSDLDHSLINNSEIENRELIRRFSRFKGYFLYGDTTKVIILNNFNESNSISNEEVMYLQEHNFIIVNLYDENHQKVRVLKFKKQQNATSPLGKIFTRSMPHKFNKIINIESNFSVEGYDNREFENFYDGILELREMIV